MDKKVIDQIEVFHKRRDALKTEIDQARGREQELKKQRELLLKRLSELGVTEDTAPARIAELDKQIAELIIKIEEVFTKIDENMNAGG